MKLFALTLLQVLVEAAKKEAPLPEPDATWPMFVGLAILGLIGTYLAKQNGIGELAAALGAATAFAALEAAQEVIFKPQFGLSIVAGGHAAVSTILFATPAKSMADTFYGVVGGHVIATLVGMAQLALAPAALDFATKTVTVTLVILAQKALGAVHPPACAFAFMFVGGGKTYEDAIGPIVGCAVLILLQQGILAATDDGKKKKA